MSRVLAIIVMIVFVLFWFVGFPVRVLFEIVRWVDKKLSFILDEILKDVL